MTGPLRRVCLLGLALACGLAVAAPALALPHLGKRRSQAVSALVGRFVDDLVLRRDLADGWRISGPNMRGGITRKEWMTGRQLPVQRLDILNDPRKSWYVTWKSRSQIGLVVSLRIGRGEKAMMFEEETVLVKRHGHWVVDTFYPDGIFRLGRGHSGSCVSAKCKVTGLFDYRPSSAGGFAPAKARIGGGWGIAVIVALLSIPVAGLLGIGLVVYVRNRRARSAYLASRSS